MENKSSYILEGLSEEQRKAVECIDGPVLIVAGAGSGKTRVLTSRTAYIIDQGCPPEQIMALTFTKKAAGEMKERIAAMVGNRNSWKICMGTFHSVFIRFLREFADRLGYPSTFTIYDTSDSQSAIKACVKELQLDDKVYKPKDVLSRISMAKNNLVTPGEYRNRPSIITNDTHSRKPRICDIYSLYAKKCRESGVMDFDDILLNMNILLRDCPDVLEAIARRYKYIMVDEYQDTNYAQYLIIKKLSQFHQNLCVVGDDSQSIYAFRGARIENILNFRKDFPQCRTFRLENNYRSTEVIVKASNSLIAKNQGRIPKECRSTAPGGEKINVLSAYNEQEEAVRVAGAIVRRLQDDKARYCDFAVLYRTNAQSRAIEEILRKRNLPYVIYSGHSFFERAEVKDLMAYFKLAVNPNDSESFKRAVKVPSRGIGDTSMARLSELAAARGQSLIQTAASLAEGVDGWRKSSVTALREFCQKVQSWSQLINTEDAYTLAKRIADESGLYAFYRADTSIEGASRLQNIDELLNSVSQYVEDTNAAALAELEAEVSENQDVEAQMPEQNPQIPLSRLDGFIENISLLSSVDMSDGEDSSNKISLMTVHSSKGLEFPYVFVVGMEENLFPSGGMLASPQDIEEERRLFYVAVTRAEKVVYLSYAQERMRNGQHESNSVSRFLKEIDSDCLDHPVDQDDNSFGSRRSFGGSSYGSGSYGSFGSRGYGGGYGSSRGGGSPRGYGASGGGSVQRGSGSYTSGRSTAASNPSRPVPSSSGASRYGSETYPSSTRTSQGSSSGAFRSAQPIGTIPQYDEATFQTEPMTSFQIGQRVEHIRFGPGLILDLSGSAPEIKAKIRFDAFQDPKIILLKYAKMRSEKK